MGRHELERDTQHFFFLAMEYGYANPDRQTTPIVEMPGYKSIPFSYGDFRFLDVWMGDKVTGNSLGLTTIWWQDKPVWFMSYDGAYPKDVIPFLKRALAQNYGRGVFLGCRGPHSFIDREQGLLYNNRVHRNHFIDFAGREEILDLEENTVIGYHEYKGRFLI